MLTISRPSSGDISRVGAMYAFGCDMCALTDDDYVRVCVVRRVREGVIKQIILG